MIDIDAITKRYGHKEGLTIRGDEILSWPYSEPRPSAAEAKDLTDKNAKSRENKGKRRMEMPPAEIQLDMMYKDAVDGTTTWKDTLDALYRKYPKE